MIMGHPELVADPPAPIVFMPVAVNTTSGRLYDDFLRLLFLHAHREASALAGELPEEPTTNLINFVFFALPAWLIFLRALLV